MLREVDGMTQIGMSLISIILKIRKEKGHLRPFLTVAPTSLDLFFDAHARVFGGILYFHFNLDRIGSQAS